MEAFFLVRSPPPPHHNIATSIPLMGDLEARVIFGCFHNVLSHLAILASLPKRNVVFFHGTKCFFDESSA